MVSEALSANQVEDSEENICEEYTLPTARIYFPISI